MKSRIHVLIFFTVGVESFVHPPTSRSCTTRRRTEIFRSSKLNLFNGPPSGSTSVLERTSQKNRIRSQEIPKGVLDSLENGAALPFDYTFEHSNTKIRLKQLEKGEVSKAVGLCLKEYGSYPSKDVDENDPIAKFTQSISEDFDNFLFSFVVLLGLGQRVERREKGDSDPSAPQDHNVVCIYEVDEKTGQETMAGMAEVSLQPPDPARTSPPFVVPTNLKKLFSSFYGAPDPKPYISNVLVTNDFRGKGYSRVLMACCEGLAKKWDYNEVYLHVDADQRSGYPAQRLYRSLDYMPVIDEHYNKKFSWMGIDSVNRGLYIVDGVALLFLKKELN
jgi:GNAT superfamily N-acetyltransferase